MPSKKKTPTSRSRGTNRKSRKPATHKSKTSVKKRTPSSRASSRATTSRPKRATAKRETSTRKMSGSRTRTASRPATTSQVISKRDAVKPVTHRGSKSTTSSSGKKSHSNLGFKRELSAPFWSNPVIRVHVVDFREVEPDAWFDYGLDLAGFQREAENAAQSSGKILEFVDGDADIAIIPDAYGTYLKEQAQLHAPYVVTGFAFVYKLSHIEWTGENYRARLDQELRRLAHCQNPNLRADQRSRYC